MCHVLSLTGPAKTPKAAARKDAARWQGTSCGKRKVAFGPSPGARPSATVRKADSTLAQVRRRALTQSTCQNKTVAKVLIKRGEVLLDEADSGRDSMFVLGGTQPRTARGLSRRIDFDYAFG